MAEERHLDAEVAQAPDELGGVPVPAERYLLQVALGEAREIRCGVAALVEGRREGREGGVAALEGAVEVLGERVGEGLGGGGEPGRGDPELLEVVAHVDERPCHGVEGPVVGGGEAPDVLDAHLCHGRGGDPHGLEGGHEGPRLVPGR